MYGTRLRSPRAQAINAEQPQALVVAHGQPSDPLPAEAALSELTARVQAFLTDAKIASATMANPGALEQAMELLPADAPVYPLFMADGWFVKTALAKRLQNNDLRVLAPLGLDDRLPSLAAQAVRGAIESKSWKVAETHILLAAHGSAQGKAAAKSARLFASRLAAILPSTSLSIGFIEEAPFLKDAATGLTPPALCLPFFAMEGEHVRDDIPAALANAGFCGEVLPPFGKYNGVARLIADTLSADLGKRKAA